ncbi:hypothetical protein [uncultured Piscinibacter sp.]|uniref:hypothetical protein n=1 Tax=uncultured Piscinibacter sp. TaxID=1131835 RepID=UPI00261C31F1|nr:hypothetical protein [uncultured Piscinibacter sp.]
MSITGLLTFGGALAQTPDVLERHGTLVLDLPPECADSWVELTVTNPPQWLDPPEVRRTALKLLEEAVRLDLARRGRELTLEVEPKGAANPQGAQALEEVGRRLSAPLLVVADVSFNIEPQPKTCSMRMRVSAEMRLASPGTDVTSTPSVMLDRASSLSVAQWAKNPDIGSQLLRNLVVQLGKDVLDALPKPPPG